MSAKKRRESWNPNRLFRAVMLLVVVSICAAIAALIRDAGFGLFSTEDVLNWFRGSYRPWSLADGLVNFVLLLGLLVAIVWFAIPYIRDRFRPDFPDVASPSSKSIDQPLTDPANDELDRFRFAKEIASTIMTNNAKSSLVVALEAPWGEGKTTVLNWIRSELADHPSRPVIANFDPWPEDSKRGVVARLLDTIANALVGRGDLPRGIQLHVSELFGRLADAAAKDKPTTYGALQTLFTILMYPDRSRNPLRPNGALESDRENLRDWISKLRHRLVVFVDDLDRSDGSELRTVLMAVNALSTFTNTTVVIAFDPEVIDSTLDAEGHRSRGSNFREKIVQLSCPLPKTSFRDKNNLFESTLQQVLAEHGALDVWRSWTGEAIPQAVLKTVEFATSPRSLKRLANHTAFLAATLGPEVNSGDILLLELLRGHYMPVWHYIRTHASSFDQRTLVDLITERNKKDVPTHSDLAENTLSSQDRKREARSVLDLLFPQFSKDPYTRSEDPSAESQSRVSIPRNLQKYFHLGVESDDVSNAAARRFVADPSARQDLIVNSLKRSSLATLFEAAAKQIDPNRPVDDPLQLAQQVQNAAAELWISKRIDASDEAVLLLYKIIESHGNPNRGEILRRVLTNTSSIAIGERLLLDLLKHAHLWPATAKSKRDPSAYFEDQLLKSDELELAKAEWLKTAWSTGIDNLYRQEPAPTSIVFRMAQLDSSEAHGYARVKDAMGRYLEDSGNLFRFVSQFSAKVRGINYGIDGTDRLIPNWREFLERVAQLSEPADAVEKFREALHYIRKDKFAEDNDGTDGDVDAGRSAGGGENGADEGATG